MWQICEWYVRYCPTITANFDLSVKAPSNFQNNLLHLTGPLYVTLQPSIENLISTILYICRGSSVTSSWQAIRHTDRHSSSGSHMSAIFITSIASQNSKAQRERFIKTLKFLVFGWVSIFFSISFFLLILDPDRHSPSGSLTCQKLRFCFIFPQSN